MQEADGCGTSLNHAVVIVGFQECDDGDNTPDPPTPDPDDNTDPDPPTPDPVSNCSVDKWWYSCEEPVRRLQDADGNCNYWKVQNSWGTWWGDGGFIRLAITDGAGVCGINQVAEYADWESSMYN